MISRRRVEWERTSPPTKHFPRSGGRRRLRLSLFERFSQRRFNYYGMVECGSGRDGYGQWRDGVGRQSLPLLRLPLIQTPRRVSFSGAGARAQLPSVLLV